MEGVRRPRPAGKLRRHYPVAVGDEQRTFFGHQVSDTHGRRSYGSEGIGGNAASSVELLPVRWPEAVTGPGRLLVGPVPSPAMELRTLGRTGVKVSPLCLGAMMFGAWGTTDHDECIRIIERALDAGINFIDTADVYSAGESEEIVGKALARVRRDNIVLATKVHGQMAADPNAQGNSRRWIVAECEHSLRRLGTDYIDLYQIHRPSPDTDIDETLGALTDLVHAGKVRYIGSSTFPADDIVEAQWVAERRQPGTVRDRAASLFDPGPQRRGRRPPPLPAVRHGRALVEPAGRRLAVGRVRVRAGEHESAGGPAP